MRAIIVHRNVQLGDTDVRLEKLWSDKTMLLSAELDGETIGTDCVDLPAAWAWLGGDEAQRLFVDTPAARQELVRLMLMIFDNIAVPAMRHRRAFASNQLSAPYECLACSKYFGLDKTYDRDVAHCPYCQQELLLNG